jgi:DNA-binding GntR family transcriptional regulator
MLAMTRPTTLHNAANGRRLASYVYDILKERLLEGYWRAGEHIVVEALKSEFGVSKQPVMEALRSLAGDGLVEIIPQVGCRVPTSAPEETSDFFTLFASIEAESAAIATTRCKDSDIARLVEINRQIGTYSALPDRRDRVRHYRTFNRQFHSAILEMARSSVVMRTGRRMWDMCDLLINTSGDTDPLADEIGERHAEHELIIDALRARDVTEVRDHMRKHILRNIPMLERAAGTERDGAGADQ